MVFAPVSSRRGWGEFGVELAVAARGRGLATEAAGLILGLGFGPLALEGVTASSITENARIARLLRALGFTERGTRREPGWMDRRGWTRTDWALEQNTFSLQGALAPLVSGGESA